MVKVFSKPGCNGCTATKREMKKQGIEFEELDITQNDGALEEIMSLGYQGVPVVVTADEHWHGFKPEKIRAL